MQPTHKKSCLTACLTAVLPLAVAAGCQQTGSPKGAKEPAGEASANAVVTVALPVVADFPLTNGSAGDHLKALVYRLTASERRCADFEVYELHDFPEKGPLELEVSDACDYEFDFAVGKAFGDDPKDFKPYYRTAEPAFIERQELKEEGESTVRLHLKRTKLGTDASFTATWVRPGEDPDDSTPDPTDGTPPAYEPEVREIMARRCTSCHAVGASRAFSPLTTYSEVKTYAEAVVLRSANKTMPPAGGTPLSDEEIQILNDWKAAGYPEAKITTGGTQGGTTGGTTTGGTTTGPNGEREFRIKAGTGNGAWNTADTIVTLKVGETLRIYNDDSVNHQLHTNGAPCPHGGLIRPGAFEDCRATRAYDGPALYDHNTNGPFHIRATP